MPSSVAATKENIFLFVPNIIGLCFHTIVFHKISHVFRPSSLPPPHPFNSIMMRIFIDIFSGYGRIVLAIIAFYFMRTNYVIAGWCYIVSALLDSVDGHAARHFNQSK